MGDAVRQFIRVFFDRHTGRGNLLELGISVEGVVFIAHVALQDDAKLLVHRIVLILVDGGGGVVVLFEEAPNHVARVEMRNGDPCQVSVLGDVRVHAHSRRRNTDKRDLQEIGHIIQ